MAIGRKAILAVTPVILAFFLCALPAVARDSEASYHWMTLAGYHLRFKNDPEKAREALLKSLEKDPENFKALEMLKSVEERIGANPENLKSHEVIESGPSFQWYDNALFLWERRRDVKGAIRCLERSLQENPFNTRAAELLQKIKRENSISDDPGVPQIKVVSGDRAALDAASRREEAGRWVASSGYHLKKQDYAKALVAARKAVELDPGSDEARRNLEKIEKQQKEHVGLAISRKIDPAGQDLSPSIGGDGPTAGGGQIVRSPEGRAGHWFWLGKYYFSVKGEYAQALECFERTILLDPSNEDARTMINRCKAKLFFVSGGTAVKIRDHRGTEERARLAKAIEDVEAAESFVTPEGEVRVRTGPPAPEQKVGPIETAADMEKFAAAMENKTAAEASQEGAPATAAASESGKPETRETGPDPDLMREEEVILVSDYEIEDRRARAEARRSADPKALPEDSTDPVVSPYAKWVERKKNFETLTRSLFAGYWKDDGIKKPERDGRAVAAARRGSIESSMEEVWKRIAAGETDGADAGAAAATDLMGSPDSPSRDVSQPSVPVKAVDDQALRTSTAGLDIMGMKSADEYARRRRERLERAAQEAMGQKSVSFIDESLAEEYRLRLGKAEELARTGKRGRAIDEYRKVFEDILIKDAENLEALYNLLLLHMDRGNYDFATVVYFKLLGLSDRLKPGSRISREIGELIFCFLKSTIIQSTVAAYNGTVRDFSRRMGPGTLSVPTLSNAGFLATGGEPYELSLKVFDKIVKVSVSIEDFNCSAGGRFQMRGDGVVECSVHGVGPYVLLHAEKKSDI